MGGGVYSRGAFILKLEILGGRLFEAGRLFEEIRYADYNMTSNGQSNGCKIEQFVNKYLCTGGLILFLSFSNGEHERKRVRYQQQNFDGLHPKL